MSHSLIMGKNLVNFLSNINEFVGKVVNADYMIMKILKYI
jgi:hypothetical protein